MKCGLLVCAAAALSSSPVLAQSVYVAPGGVYIASARVIVAPGGGAPYVAPDAPPAAYDGSGYGPGYAAPSPTAYVDPGYGPGPGYYGNSGYPPPPGYGAPGYAAPAAGYGAAGYPPPGYGGGGYPPPAPGYGGAGYAQPGPGYGPGYPPRPGYGAPGYGAPGYAAPGYGAPGYGPPLATRASYGRPAVYAERRLTNVHAYAAEGPPRPPAAIPRVGTGRCVVNLGNGRWASCN
jgi:hypothetical protein